MFRMVFDVESIGLFGEGFAVGYVVIDGTGAEVANGMYACDPQNAVGSESSRIWVRDNVPALPYNCIDPKSMRDMFWRDFVSWKGKTCELWADCAWPVEAGFLIACINDDLGRREWGGPYPLHEIASMLNVMGHSPLEPIDRLESELPMHHPVADARQSARILHNAMSCLKSGDSARLETLLYKFSPHHAGVWTNEQAQQVQTTEVE